MGELYGSNDGERLIVRRRVTHDQLAAIVGGTRQWVTMTLDRFQKQGIISVSRQTIAIERSDLLLAYVEA
jgi:CRP-like cAMP-binding protein